MIDWNNNGKIDSEEFVLTEIMLEDAEKDAADADTTQKTGRSKGAGCLTGLLILAVAVVVGILL
jgi:hypothetical protein